MSVNIQNNIIKLLYEYTNEARDIADNKTKKQIDRILGLLDWIEIEKLKQNRKIAARVKEKRQINKNYSRGKKKCYTK